MIEKLKIFGNQQASGKVKISGAKNAALPILAASILCDKDIHLKNVPNLVDISVMIELLNGLGVITNITNNQITGELELLINAANINNQIASYDLVKKMRASILVLGPLLAKYGMCKVSLPGGCAIGVRPVDLHIAGMQALGASVEIQNGYIYATAKKGLRGTHFHFRVTSVTGTENLIMAAVLATGTTVLTNAAMEPEIIDLAQFLISMGAKISGAGTSTIIIEGVQSLQSTTHTIIADRIEAGTYAIAAGITKGKIDLIGNNLDLLLSEIKPILQKTGMVFSNTKDGICVSSCGEIHPVDFQTYPYPGYPTDLQAQTMALLTISNGTSVITETIWENRFMHVCELVRMGADITVNGNTAVIRGVKKLEGTTVMATDLRASFSLVLAALAATGDTIIDRIYHLKRGYSHVEKKLHGCGIRCEIIT